MCIRDRPGHCNRNPFTDVTYWQGLPYHSCGSHQNLLRTDAKGRGGFGSHDSGIPKPCLACASIGVSAVCHYCPGKPGLQAVSYTHLDVYKRQVLHHLFYLIDGKLFYER